MKKKPPPPPLTPFTKRFPKKLELQPEVQRAEPPKPTAPKRRRPRLSSSGRVATRKHRRPSTGRQRAATQRLPKKKKGGESVTAFGSSAVVYLRHDPHARTRTGRVQRPRGGPPLALVLGIPTVLLFLGGALFVFGDQPVKHESPRPTPKSTTAPPTQQQDPQQQAPEAEPPAQKELERRESAPPSELDRGLDDREPSAREESSRMKAWQAREKELLDAERDMWGKTEEK